MAKLIKKDTPPTERPAPAPKPETPEQQIARLRKQWLAEKNAKDKNRTEGVMQWLRS